MSCIWTLLDVTHSMTVLTLPQSVLLSPLRNKIGPLASLASCLPAATLRSSSRRLRKRSFSVYRSVSTQAPSSLTETKTWSPSLCCEAETSSGSLTSMPRPSIGVTTMKMMSSTRHTSTSGVTLISLLVGAGLTEWSFL